MAVSASGVISGRNMGDVRTAGRLTSGLQSEAKKFDEMVEGGLKPNTKKTTDVAVKENSFFSFVKAVIDVINPLQHIPVVATIYREMTGDEISPGARLVGDTLYGGPVGAAIAFANIATEKATGKDVGQTLVAMATDNKGIPYSNKEIAQDVDTYFKQQVARAKSDKTIIWNDAPVVDTAFTTQTAPTPRPAGQSTRVAENLPARESSYKAHPMPAVDLGEESATQKRPTAVLPIVLSDTPAHEAPVDVGREPPLEQIAASTPVDISAKMMEALDKYAAMKKGGLNNARQDYPMF